MNAATTLMRWMSIFLFVSLPAFAENVLLLHSPNEELQGTILQAEKPFSCEGGDCDLQYLNAKAPSTLRLKKDALITFASPTSVANYLQKGSALFVVREHDLNDPYRVYTDHLLIQAASSQFALEGDVEPDFFSSSEIMVHKGQVRVRIRIPEIENLPPTIILQSKVLSYIVSSLLKTTSVLQKGDFVTVDDYDTRSFLVHSGLAAILKKTPEKDLPKVLDAQFDNDAFRLKVKNFINEPLGFLVDRYEPSAYERTIVEFAELSPVPSELVNNKEQLTNALRERQRKNRYFELSKLVKTLEAQQEKTHAKITELKQELKALEKEQIALAKQPKVYTTTEGATIQAVAEQNAEVEKGAIEMATAKSRTTTAEADLSLQELEKAITALEKKMDKIDSMSKQR
ncbi:MAG: hypothetical protein AAF518_05990 [Spirochaetota bacterium]